MANSIVPTGTSEVEEPVPKSTSMAKPAGPPKKITGFCFRERTPSPEEEKKMKNSLAVSQRLPQKKI